MQPQNLEELSVTLHCWWVRLLVIVVPVVLNANALRTALSHCTAASAGSGAQSQTRKCAKIRKVCTGEAGHGCTVCSFPPPPLSETRIISFNWLLCESCQWPWQAQLSTGSGDFRGVTELGTLKVEQMLCCVNVEPHFYEHPNCFWFSEEMGGRSQPFFPILIFHNGIILV